MTKYKIQTQLLQQYKSAKSNNLWMLFFYNYRINKNNMLTRTFKWFFNICKCRLNSYQNYIAVSLLQLPLTLNAWNIATIWHACRHTDRNTDAGQEVIRKDNSSFQLSRAYHGTNDKYMNDITNITLVLLVRHWSDMEVQILKALLK